MDEILVVLRFKQLFGHNFHNLVKGESFFADHEFLSQWYSQGEEQYDSVVERMIGLGLKVDLVEIQEAAVDLLKKNPPLEFSTLELCEQQLIEQIENYIAKEKISQGTLQLLGDIANQAEMNLYKIKQRLAK